MRRLMGRQTESEESIRRRIDRAQMEMAMQDEFDVVVVNDDLDRATEELDRLLRQ